MACLHCGKEIGAFRLLRDSEFCCALHRLEYGERLGKALHVMFAPEPAPAGVAGFLDQMPFQPGNRSSTLIPWQAVGARGRIRTGTRWLLTIDTSHAANGAATLHECAPVQSSQQSERGTPGAAPEPTLRLQCSTAAREPASDLVGTPRPPARCDRWMPVPAPEPVAAFVAAYAAPATAETPRVLRFAATLEPIPVLDLASHAPRFGNWMPVPQPEPVAAFVAAYAALAAADTPRALRLAATLGPVPVLDLASHAPRFGNWMPVPQPEPVAAFVAASTALAPADTARALRFAAELEPVPFLELAPYTLPACDNRLPAAAPGPVAAFVTASAPPASEYAPRRLLFTAEPDPAPPPDANLAACSLRMPGFAVADARGAPADASEPAYGLSVERSAAPPRMPAPEFIGQPEPLPVLDVPLTPPPMCQRWMPAPPADPVFSYLRTSLAPAVAVPPAMKMPAFGMFTAGPRVARMDQAQPLPPAEEAMPGIARNVAITPLAPVHPAAAMALPAIPQAAQEWFAASGPASTPMPEAVERRPVATQASEAVSTTHAPLRNVALGAPPVFLGSAPARGEAMPGPAPAALESLLVASVAAPMALAAPVRLLPFLQEATGGHTRPGFDIQHLTPELRQPAAAGPRLVAPQPIATLAVTTPPIGRRRVESGLPRPGLLPVEYYSQGLRNAPVGSLEWRTSRPALLPPPFLLGPVLEKLEEPAPLQKAARPGFGTLRTMPGAKRPPSVLMVAGRVAAGFVLAASLWVGVAHFRGDRRLMAQEEVPSGDVVLSPADRAARALNGGTPAPTGPVAWVRRTIAHRAALKIGDDFRGMENWNGDANARPPGWKRHPDGYVNTGALAVFRPSLKFTDLRLEFFGQIETKSIGWTVRATDAMNYHAMKLTVMEAGMRPFVALVQYNVVDGKPGHRTQTPLNIMVHNKQPMQFAVDVRGNRVVTSIDGEEVDSFFDNTLAAGGVGFFSDAGERARLYWMRVSRNDDWLGHVCAMLADGAAEGSTAGLRGPRLPGSAPAPGLPGDEDGMALAGMWIALPYLRATRKARFFKTWRSEPWNTQAKATPTVCQCRQA